MRAAVDLNHGIPNIGTWKIHCHTAFIAESSPQIRTPAYGHTGRAMRSFSTTVSIKHQLLTTDLYVLAKVFAATICMFSVPTLAVCNVHIAAFRRRSVRVRNRLQKVSSKARGATLESAKREASSKARVDTSESAEQETMDESSDVAQRPNMCPQGSMTRLVSWSLIVGALA